MKNLFVRIVLLLLSLFLFWSSPATCQVPDEFVNLKVLPRDISKADLVKTMKSYTAALGVRCLFCHVGKEGEQIKSTDFAKDDKEEKKTARIMMTMTRDINQKYLTTLGKPAERLTQVTCATCHHGLQEPRMLEDVLHAAINKEGAKSALKKYKDLRDQYYGTFTFDFSEAPLNRLARSLQDEGKVADGIEMLKLNEQYFPKSGTVQFLMGELYLKNGAKEDALQRYKKCLELDPENEDAKKKVEELTKKP